jgi:6-phosphogluconolactonase/glucosamine-6-phosphate isomerase/deaminase
MIKIINVKNRDEGNFKAHELLKDLIDNASFLVLSGGTSPDYRKIIVEPSDISVEAVCLADERFGLPLHENSNELLLEDSGLVKYFEKWGIDFYKILEGQTFKKTMRDYNIVISQLFKKFKKKIGIMGIGANLHTAGIFPGSQAVRSKNYVIGQEVSDKFPKRITLTVKALEEFTNFIILMFGKEKQPLLRRLLERGVNDVQKYPAIFYRKTKIKNYLITDQDL